jgi:hypothetical protein
MHVSGRLRTAAIGSSRGWLLAMMLLLVGAASLALSSLPLASPAVPLSELAQPASGASGPAAPIQSAPVPNPAASHTCVVSGDLVGDGNPSQVAAALCHP